MQRGKPRRPALARWYSPAIPVPAFPFHCVFLLQVCSRGRVHIFKYLQDEMERRQPVLQRRTSDEVDFSRKSMFVCCLFPAPSSFDLPLSSARGATAVTSPGVGSVWLGRLLCLGVRSGGLRRFVWGAPRCGHQGTGGFAAWLRKNAPARTVSTFHRACVSSLFPGGCEPCAR